jgi:hypothetical protein
MKFARAADHARREVAERRALAVATVLFLRRSWPLATRRPIRPQPRTCLLGPSAAWHDPYKLCFFRPLPGATKVL